MDRRSTLGFLAAGTFVLSGHTPYGQWVAYRKKHLLIGAHRKDLPGYDEAKNLAALLQEHLSTSRARVARARSPSRLASLLSTGQLDVALLDHDTIRAMRQADGTFAAYGAIDLRVISNLAGRSLVAVSDFRADHAWLVAEALADETFGDVPDDLPWHPGADAYRQGQTLTP